MISNARLAKIGDFELRPQHLLVVGILALSFSVSFLIRFQPADFGYELNEFDPFYNYRATEYLVRNGLDAYMSWHDDMSWYPTGRDISASSQMMLHLTAAYTYHMFGGSSSVYDYTIIFPVIFGSFTTIVIFALVRVIGGTTAGLFASLFFALSVPVIVRGMLGWFKSEPLGLFYGLLGIYLFLSGIKSADKRVALLKMTGAGVFLAFGLSAWGGVQFFIIPLGVFILALPFIRHDIGFLTRIISVFAVALILTTALFERPGITFFAGIGGLAILGPIAYMAACVLVRRISSEKNIIRNYLILLGGAFVAGISMLIVIFSTNLVGRPSFRYLNAINPFFTSQNPLTDSVAEHATTTTAQSFFFLSVLMIFAALGVWLLFRNRERLQSYRLQIPPDMVAFSLIMGILGIYVSSAFVRLELFASIAVIILASVGLAIISAEIFKHRIKSNKKSTSHPLALKISFVAAVVVLLVIPTVVPAQGNWIDSIRAPPTILNGGTNYGVVHSDWPDALAWLKNNTPEDTIVAAWWDYGYWITTAGNRTSLADNATMHILPIQNLARIFLNSPDESWRMLSEAEADYMLIFIAANKIQQDPTGIYLLGGGGDESKKQWFMRIAEDRPLSTYVHNDGFTGTDHFWNDTLLGKMIPYTPITYVNFALDQQSETYRPGFTAAYIQDIKYPADGDGPLRLAYASASFDRDSPGAITAVLIYEVNKNYGQPSNATSTDMP